ncbi:MAG: hypothetical protein P4L76_11275 [Beijerinckiaceae bacterium]|nr:hypothetical protein [Beijerinckiaceae bacterium]
MIVKEARLFVAEDTDKPGDSIKMPLEQSRLDQLVTIVDHCTAAKDIADALGDTFLAYMLSMTIQSARTEMRPKTLRARR